MSGLGLGGDYNFEDAEGNPASPSALGGWRVEPSPYFCAVGGCMVSDGVGILLGASSLSGHCRAGSLGLFRDPWAVPVKASAPLGSTQRPE